MLDFLKSSSHKEQIEAIEKSAKQQTDVGNKLIFLIKMRPNVLSMMVTFDDCKKFLQHLLDWPKYSLSEVELDDIRLRFDAVSKLHNDFGQVLERFKSLEGGEEVTENCLAEIEMQANNHKGFCQVWIEKLKKQNPLLTMFFSGKF